MKRFSRCQLCGQRIQRTVHHGTDRVDQLQRKFSKVNTNKGMKICQDCEKILEKKQISGG